MGNHEEREANLAGAPPPGWHENSDGVLQWWDGVSWGPIAPTATADNPTAPTETEVTVPHTVEDDGPIEAVQAHGEPYHASQPVKVSRSNPLGVCSTVAFLVGLLFLATGDSRLFIILLVLGVVLGIIGIIVGVHRGKSLVSAILGTALPVLAVGFALVAYTITTAVASDPPVNSSSLSTSQAPEVSEPEPDPEPEPQLSAAEQRDSRMEEQGFRTWESGEIWLKAVDPENYTCGYGTRCIWYELASYNGCASGYYVKADVVNAEGLAIDWTNAITASVQPQDGVAFELSHVDIGGESVRITEVSCMG